MKVLMFADLHGNIDKIPKLEKKAKDNDVDVVICAGDFTVFGMKQRKILKKFDAMGYPFILIPGNHEDEFELLDECEKYDNIVYLHMSAYRVGKYLFFGYGSGGFALEDPDFEDVSMLFKNDIKDKDKVILLTHGPPHGTKLDDLNGRFIGNKSITKFIKEVDILLAVSGHIHENAGQRDKIGKTLLINPGMDGVVLDLSEM